MSNIVSFGISEFLKACSEIAVDIKKRFPAAKGVAGVPRGGIPAAIEIAHLTGLPLYEICGSGYVPNDFIVVDDILDSGSTRNRFKDHPFYVLVGKSTPFDSSLPFTSWIHTFPKDTWVEFWWERNEAPAEDAVRRLIQVIGDDPNREGLLETPARVLKSYKKLFGGYETKDVSSILKTFTEGACDSLVLVKGIEMYSMCEHHVLPFFGECSIGYIPNGKVVGVSKLVRLMEVFTRRLQIQERIGDQITDALMTHLDCKGAACVISAQHMCMTSRGVEKQNSKMITSSLKGVFLEKADTRAEFMSMIRG